MPSSKQPAQINQGLRGKMAAKYRLYLTPIQDVPLTIELLQIDNFFTIVWSTLKSLTSNEALTFYCSCSAMRPRTYYCHYKKKIVWFISSRQLHYSWLYWIFTVGLLRSLTFVDLDDDKRFTTTGQTCLPTSSCSSTDLQNLKI